MLTKLRMIKWILLFLVLPFSLEAQTTTVSGTITDAGGQAWFNGTYTFTFRPNPGNSTQQHFQNGVPFDKFFTTSGFLDATGSLSGVAIPDNQTITPAGSQYDVQVCPAATFPCFKLALMITGASQSITSSVVPPAIAINLINPPNSNMKAYADGEISSAVVGSTYYNLISQQFRYCQVISGNLCTTWAVTGTGAVGAAAGTPVQMQVNAGGGPPNTFGGTNCTTLDAFPSTKQERHDCDTHFKGGNIVNAEPWSDITRFGARAVDQTSAPQIPGITASCTNGQPTVTLSSASAFQNGDGITIFNCGPAQTMTTPVAPAVTPSVNTAGVKTGAVANSPTGSTTYSYEIVAFDNGGGMTAASAPGSTTVGLASIGYQTVNITSLSKSNNVVTVTTATPHTLAVGAMIDIRNTSDSPNFGGWYSVTSVPDTTHFTYISGIDTRGSSSLNFGQGVTTSATGGDVEYWLCNQLSWTAVTGARAYAIYRMTGAGSPKLIGISKPTDTLFPITDTSFCDDGDGMQTPFQGQYFLPIGAPPSSPTHDSLTTTIVSGAGSTSLTLATNAGNSTSGQTALFDDGPAMIAAGVNGATIYIPQNPANTSFVVNSNTILPSNPNTTGSVTILQRGNLWLNDTIVLPSATVNWWGNSFPPQSANTAVSFAINSYSNVSIGAAFPGVFLPSFNSMISMRGIIFGGQNNGLTTVIDGLQGSSFYEVGWGSDKGSGNDFTSMGLLIRSSNFDTVIDGIYLSANQVRGTSCPMFFCNTCGITHIDKMILSARGMAFYGGTLTVDFGRLQASDQPTFVPMQGYGALGGVLNAGGGGNVGTVQVTNFEQDTAGDPLVSVFVAVGSNSVIPSISVNGGAPNAGDNGGTLPVVTGTIPASSSINPGGVFSVNLAATGYNLSSNTLVGGTLAGGWTNSVQGFANTGGPAIGVQLPPPTSAPALSLAAGGSVSVASHSYQISWTDPFGNFTTAGPAALITTTTGNQTVNIIPPSSPPVGATGWVFYRDGNQQGATNAASGNIGCGPFPFTFTAQDGSASLLCATSNTLPRQSAAVSNGGTYQGMAVSNLHISGGINSVPLGAYDNFNRANAAIGPSWTVLVGTLSTNGNQLIGSTNAGGVENAAFYSAQAFFAPDQFSQETITATNSSSPQVFVRSTTTASGYDCSANSNTNTLFLQKNAAVGPGATNITSTAYTPAIGDILRIEVTGGIVAPSGLAGSVNAPPTIKCIVTTAGVATVLINSQDLSLTPSVSGSPGLGFFNTSSSSSIDNWSGGDLQPIAMLNAEQDWTQPQHFTQGVTFGATNPIAGSLSPGAYLSTESPNLNVCTDANKRLTTTGCVTAAVPIQTFSSKNLAANVSLVANTLATVDSITINAAGGAAPAFQSSTGTWRAQVCYTYIVQQGTGSNAGEAFATDGTNNWALSQQIISGGSSQSYIACGWSTVTYTGAAAVTFSVKAENPGAETILATSPLTSNPSRMQVAISASN